MIQRIALVLLTITILAGCQSISDQELEVLNARAEKADQLQSENEQLKQGQDALVETVIQLNEQLEQEISAKQVLVEQNATGGIKLTLQQEIIFPSGTYKLEQKEAGDILKKVANSIDPAANNRIRIIGHTDNLPVHNKLHSQFTDNWDLSARRAGEVARYFIWGLGFAPENIEVVGRADVEPVASNATKEGRAQNRRIEILIKK